MKKDRFTYLYEPAMSIEEIERSVQKAVSIPVIDHVFDQWDKVYHELALYIRGRKNPQYLQLNETGLLAISFYEGLLDFLIKDGQWAIKSQAQKYRAKYDEFKKQLDLISDATYRPTISN